MSSLAGGGGGGGGAYTKGTPVDVTLSGGESITVPSGVYWIVTLSATSRANTSYADGSGSISINGKLAVNTLLDTEGSQHVETVVTESSTIKYSGGESGHVGGVALPL